MWSSPRTVLTLYGLSALVLTGAFQLRIQPSPTAVRPLERARGRGELAAGIPRLDADDPMANAAILADALDKGRVRGCSAAPRSFHVQLEGRTRHVRVPSHVVCQLAMLKAISVGQPGFGARGLAEVAAFLLGRPSSEGSIELSRVVIPPFHFTRDSITFLDAELGPLAPGELLVGTYHTHPDDDAVEGLLSVTDLRYMHQGHIDFHGQLGWLSHPRGGLDWVFDVVDPRDGVWNVFAHDGIRLEAMRRRCESGRGCPLDELRIAGSENYLLVRTYEERTADAGSLLRSVGELEPSSVQFTQ